MDGISQQAALGLVPRSIKDPLITLDVNVNGFINMLEAAKANNINRMVYASSSSVFGDLQVSPKVEHTVGKVLSTYAATKITYKLYAEAYAKNYNMSICGFKYFTVFGPKQYPEGPYAAVISLFIKAALTHTAPLINGDGSLTRDFTFIENALHANDLALVTDEPKAINHVYNVACGERLTLNEIVSFLREITGKNLEATYGPLRSGDVRHSLADIEKIESHLGYKPKVYFYEGLKKVYNWYESTKVPNASGETAPSIS